MIWAGGVTYSSVRSVRRHLTQFKLLAKVFCTRIHCGLRFHLWNVGVCFFEFVNVSVCALNKRKKRSWIRTLIQSWMQSTGDIDRVHNPRRVPALVRAVRHKVRDNTGAECLRVDICRQIVHGAIETRVFSAFVPCCKNIFCYRVLLFIVNDSLRIKCVVSHMLKVENFWVMLVCK